MVSMATRSVILLKIVTRPTNSIISRLIDSLRYLICIIMIMNENLKSEVKC